jgi:hypothetical protein
VADWNFIGVEVLVGLVLFVAIFSFAIWRGLASTPQGIVKRLRRPGGRIELSVGARRSTWDPSKPMGLDNARWGRARATYTLEDGDVVHLNYRPSSGPTEDLRGPIPETPERPRKVLRRVLFGYAAVLVVGFGVGLAIGHGPFGERLLWGTGGMMIAMLLVWVFGLIFNVGKAIRDVGRQRRTPASW